MSRSPTQRAASPSASSRSSAPSMRATCASSVSQASESVSPPWTRARSSAGVHGSGGPGGGTSARHEGAVSVSAAWLAATGIDQIVARGSDTVGQISVPLQTGFGLGVPMLAPVDSGLPGGVAPGVRSCGSQGRLAPATNTARRRLAHARRGGARLDRVRHLLCDRGRELVGRPRSEEHTSELQSHHDLVCRLLLEKKKKKIQPNPTQKPTKNNQKQ